MKCNKCKKEKELSNFDCKDNGSYNKVCNDCILYLKDSKDKLKELKICVRCGTVPSKTNKTMCKDCAKKIADAMKIKRDKAIKENKCIICILNAPEKGKLRCNSCAKKHALPLITKLFRNARARAKKANIIFTINESDIIVPEFCPIFGIKLVENDLIAKPNSYSLDRINSSEGYVKGNIHVISHRANAIKNDATIEELEKIVSYLHSLKLTK